MVNDYPQVVTNHVDYGDLMVFQSEGKIINRAELLSPETVPAKITGRVEQMEKLYKCIKPMEKDYTPTSAWLYGPPGTGKTATPRNVAEHACNTNNRISLYINCWERPTLYSIVQSLCECEGRSESVAPGGAL